jgi:predicted  nucleic acid-binding Zn-ribbon protein
LISNELKKFDSVIPAIDEYKAKFLPLKINGIEDEEGYKVVADGLKIIVGRRVAVENKRKELKADSLSFGRAVDARAKEITEMLSPIELHLKKVKEDIDLEFAKIEQKKKEAAQAEISRKHFALIDCGMHLVGNEYTWRSKVNNTEETLVDVNLELMSDDDFNTYLSSIEELNKKDKDILEEQERKAEQQRKELELEQERVRAEQKAAQDKLDAEKAAFDAEQAKFKAEQDAIKSERQAFINQRAEMRSELLVSLGLVIKMDIFGYNGNYITHLDLLKDLDTEQWNVQLAEIKSLIESFDNQKKEAEAEAKRIEAETLARLSKEAEERAEANRIAIEKAESDKKEADRLAEIEKKESEKLAEQVRQDGLSDKQKMCEFAEKVLQIPRPELKTAKYRKEMKAVLDSVGIYFN